jgi:hypothetical protein
LTKPRPSGQNAIEIFIQWRIVAKVGAWHLYFLGLVGFAGALRVCTRRFRRMRPEKSVCLKK